MVRCLIDIEPFLILPNPQAVIAATLHLVSSSWSMISFATEIDTILSLLMAGQNPPSSWLVLSLKVSDSREKWTLISGLLVISHHTHNLWSICETIFDILLVTYIASLEAHCNRADSQCKEENSLDGWGMVLNHANNVEVAAGQTLWHTA